jgi:hypothetical protein
MPSKGKEALFGFSGFVKVRCNFRLQRRAGKCCFLRAQRVRYLMVEALGKARALAIGAED